MKVNSAQNFYHQNNSANNDVAKNIHFKKTIPVTFILDDKVTTRNFFMKKIMKAFCHILNNPVKPKTKGYEIAEIFENNVFDFKKTLIKLEHPGQFLRNHIQEGGQIGYIFTGEEAKYIDKVASQIGPAVADAKKTSNNYEVNKLKKDYIKRIDEMIKDSGSRLKELLYPYNEKGVRVYAHSKANLKSVDGFNTVIDGIEFVKIGDKTPKRINSY